MGTPSLIEQRDLAKVHCPDLLKRLDYLEEFVSSRWYNVGRKPKSVGDDGEHVREVRKQIAREVFWELKDRFRDWEG